MSSQKIVLQDVDQKSFEVTPNHRRALQLHGTELRKPCTALSSLSLAFSRQVDLEVALMCETVKTLLPEGFENVCAPHACRLAS